MLYSITVLQLLIVYPVLALQLRELLILYIPKITSEI